MMGYLGVGDLSNSWLIVLRIREPISFGNSPFSVVSRRAVHFPKLPIQSR